MPNVLTEGSTIKCLHQGAVQVAASQSLLKVGGRAVLVQGDLDGKTISGCSTPTSQTTKPCTTTVSMMIGAAVKLTVKLPTGSKAVLLDTAAGMTDGLPAPGWNVNSAGQTRLRAI